MMSLSEIINSPPAIWTAILGFVTAIVIHAISNLIRALLDDRSKRRELTNSLHSEFNGPSMSALRNKSNLLIEKNITAPIDVIDSNSNKSSSEEILPIATLMRFYQRLSTLRQDGALRSRLISRWFGETFVWWYRVYMDQGFKDWETAHRELEDLYRWLEKDAKSRIGRWGWRSTREMTRRAMQWERWCRNADEKRRDIFKRLQEQSEPTPAIDQTDSTNPS